MTVYLGASVKVIQIGNLHHVLSRFCMSSYLVHNFHRLFTTDQRLGSENALFNWNERGRLMGKAGNHSTIPFCVAARGELVQGVQHFGLCDASLF